MLIALVNIIAGFILAAPKLKTLGARQEIESAASWLDTFRGLIGVVALILGLLMLIDGEDLLQALFAVVMGIILASNFFMRYPWFRGNIGILKAHAEWIGIGGIVVGVVGLL